MPSKRFVSGLAPTHVIIGGIVFDYASKAPYVPAGRSALGCLEYNLEHDLIRCHLCGEWGKSLAGHLAKAEGVTSQEYRREFGLNQSTSLNCPGFQRKKRRVALRLRRAGKFGASTPKFSPNTLTPKYHPPVRAEMRNLRNLCQAQIRSRVINLARDLSGTPSKADLENAGLWASTITRTFDMSLAAFMSSLGLTPNPHGAEATGLPRGFRSPIPKTLETRTQ